MITEYIRRMNTNERDTGVEPVFLLGKQMLDRSTNPAADKCPYADDNCIKKHLELQNEIYQYF